eukprot:64001_1
MENTTDSIATMIRWHHPRSYSLQMTPDEQSCMNDKLSKDHIVTNRSHCGASFKENQFRVESDIQYTHCKPSPDFGKSRQDNRRTLSTKPANNFPEPQFYPS